MMNKARYRRLFRDFVSTLVLSFLIIYSAQGAEEKEETRQSSSSYILSVTFNKGLLTFDTDRAPLRAALQELSEKTGAAFFLRSSSISNDLLSVSFKDLTVPEAIEMILKSYSYVLESEGHSGSLRVFVLSPQSSEPLPWDIVNNRATANNTTLILPAYQPPSLEFPAESPPQSLDDCQKLDVTRDTAPANQANLYPDPAIPYHSAGQIPASERIVLERARIIRAEKVFRLDHCSNLWEKAIDELENIRDDQVTALLADIAQNGKTVSLKTKAAQALWLNTAKSGFNNTWAINTLRGLSSSSDEGVSWYAREALRDYESYTSRINSGSTD